MACLRVFGLLAVTWHTLLVLLWLRSVPCFQLEATAAAKAILETNISRLYVTARNEVKRKDEEILRLRRMWVPSFPRPSAS